MNMKMNITHEELQKVSPSPSSSSSSPRQHHRHTQQHSNSTLLQLLLSLLLLRVGVSYIQVMTTESRHGRRNKRKSQFKFSELSAVEKCLRFGEVLSFRAIPSHPIPSMRPVRPVPLFLHLHFPHPSIFLQQVSCHPSFCFSQCLINCIRALNLSVL